MAFVLKKVEEEEEKKDQIASNNAIKEADAQTWGLSWIIGEFIDFVMFGSRYYYVVICLPWLKLVSNRTGTQRRVLR